MRKRSKPTRLFEFDIFTYPADGSPNNLTAGYAEERAKDEHSSRRQLIGKCLKKGMCVYSLTLNQTNIDGGALCTA